MKTLTGRLTMLTCAGVAALALMGCHRHRYDHDRHYRYYDGDRYLDCDRDQRHRYDHGRNRGYDGDRHHRYDRDRYHDDDD
jgi:hypothetical protein